MDYLLVFYCAILSFLQLDSLSPHSLPLYRKEQHEHSLKFLLLCSTEEKHPDRLKLNEGEYMINSPKSECFFVFFFN